jgi:hypothetical protein
VHCTCPPPYARPLRLEMGLKCTQNGHLRGRVGVFSVHMGQLEHNRAYIRGWNTRPLTIMCIGPHIPIYVTPAHAGASQFNQRLLLARAVEGDFGHFHTWTYSSAQTPNAVTPILMGVHRGHMSSPSPHTTHKLGTGGL